MDSNTPEHDDINLDQAEFAATADGPPTCAACSEELFGTYYEINGIPTCERCRYRAEQESQEGSPSGRFIRALAAGAGAGVVGGGIWYAVQEITGYQVGLVAIVVGWLVGKAVHWGCNSRGGWVYQGMAVTLTYLAIVLTFVPQIFTEIRDMDFDQIEQAVTVDDDLAALGGDEVPAEGSAVDQLAAEEGVAEPLTSGEAAPDDAEAEDLPVFDEEAIPEFHPVVALILGVAVLVAIAAVAPFLGGSIMGIIIIAVGLYEAWRQNKRLVLHIEGPFQIRTRPPGGTPEEEAPAAIEP